MLNKQPKKGENVRITPEGTVRVTYVPNIRTISRHSECWKQEWPLTHRPGDVRRCPHARIQELTQVPITARTQGPGTDYWRDLSPIWDPIKYQRARKALNGR